MTESVIYSVAKLGKRHFWVVGKTDAIYGAYGPPIAEGTATQKEEALDAVRKVIAERGIENATEVFAYYAKSYKKYRREAENPREPQTATFQDRDYLWEDGSYDSDQTGEHVMNWKKRQVAKVTRQYVFLSPEYDMGSRIRLDREALERDGHATSRAAGWGDDYYTEAGLHAHLAEIEERERLSRERWAAEAEKLRVSLIGKDCVFCGSSPDTYTFDNHPTCRPCFRKTHGYYRVPSNVIIHNA